MKKARFALYVRSSETREENPLFSDNELKVSFAARKLTEMMSEKVIIVDTETDEIIFKSSRGKVIINR